MTTRTWGPLLTGPLALAARDALRHIATDLARFVEPDSAEEPAESLPDAPPRYPLVGLEGFAGTALFLDYFGRVEGSDEFGDVAFQALGRAVDQLLDIETHAGLHGGFSGLAWVVEHLQRDDSDPDDPGEAIARQLFDHLDQTPWVRDYDLIGGLTGFGVWAIERMPRPLGAESLGRVVRRFADLAEVATEGLTWRTPRHLVPWHQQDQFPNGNFNLGVAHGIPGPIHVLAEAYHANVERSVAGELLERSIPWLLAQRLPAELGSRFPFCVAPGVEAEPSGFAWCYGDLGIAPSLLAAARRLGRPEWEREAIEIGLGVARRGLPDWEGTRRGDACLCHGAAGNGHLFHRLYRATGEALFAEAAVAWFEQSLSLRDPELGFGGFRFWDSDLEGNMSLEAMPGFLSGSAGVGLALLAAISDVVPEWDRLLLASIPEAEGSPFG